VTLTGALEWHFEKEEAAREIRSLSGVVGVSDQMSIKTQANATNISDDIVKALHRSWYDPRTVYVSAEGGKVKLSGTVNTWHDREEAEMTAWAAPGATSVQNNISVN
jgi:osmotically-inducible protein OsmY